VGARNIIPVGGGCCCAAQRSLPQTRLPASMQIAISCERYIPRLKRPQTSSENDSRINQNPLSPSFLGWIWYVKTVMLASRISDGHTRSYPLYLRVVLQPARISCCSDYSPHPRHTAHTWGPLTPLCSRASSICRGEMEGGEGEERRGRTRRTRKA
jgi:hypothetical protein